MARRLAARCAAVAAVPAVAVRGRRARGLAPALGGRRAAGRERAPERAQSPARCRSARSEAGLRGARGARAQRSRHGRRQRDLLPGGAAASRGRRALAGAAGRACPGTAAHGRGPLNPTGERMQYWLVMPAAGAGRRFGGAKQFASLHERTVLELALQPFIDDLQCVGGALALAPQEPRREELARRLPPHFAPVDGGPTRAHSVLNGLVALGQRAEAADWVLVHDAARPCLSAADLARLLAGLEEHSASGEPAQGALLAVPVADTVKRAGP